MPIDTLEFSKMKNTKLKIASGPKTHGQKLALKFKNDKLPLHKKLTPYKPLNAKTLRTECLLVSYGQFIRKQELSFIKYRTNLSLDEMKKRQLLDKNKIENEVTTIRDIDDVFFTAPSMKRTKPIVPIYKSLNSCLNQRLRLLLETGYRKDEYLRIDSIYRYQNKIYNLSVKRLKTQIHNFNEFISEDYQSSIKLLNVCNKTYKKLESVRAELSYLANNIFSYMSKLISLDHQLRGLQIYGRFLYYLSPSSWRQEHKDFALSIEIAQKGFNLGMTEEAETFSIFFDKLVQECYDKIVTPALYFKQPEELMYVFNTLEQRQGRHFVHVNHVRPYMEKIKEQVLILRNEVNEDAMAVEQDVKVFQKGLTATEERADELEAKFFRILNGMFYDSVASPRVLKLFVAIEYCYSRLYDDVPYHSDMMILAKEIENFHMLYTGLLEKCNRSVVEDTLKKHKNEEVVQLKKAIVASNEIRHFNRMKKRILSSFK